MSKDDQQPKSPAIPRPPGPPGPPPKPAMKKKAPGVKGSRQAPDTTQLATGDRVGGRFFVERYLGSSAGGVSYLCNDAKTQEPVVLKVLSMAFPGQETFKLWRKQIGAATRIDHDNLSGLLGMGRTDDGGIFVAMEFVEGKTLSRLVSGRREEGRTLSLRDTFTVLAHTSDALEAVHQRRMCHGVLTPYNIYVTGAGKVRVSNLAVGRVVSTELHKRHEGPFVDSIYVAPEVSENPKALGAAADLYSLGMIAAELLSPTGLSSNRAEAHEMAVDALAHYPPGLFSLVSGCLSKNPDERPTSVKAFRDEFEEIARDAGAQLEGPPPAGALPIEPAVESEESEEDDLFDFVDDGLLQRPSDDSEQERYLVQREGLDYGPFTADEVLEQLYADEIDEHTAVMDRVTEERQKLEEIDALAEAVAEYIPKREERLRLEAERRAELTRKAKKGGVAALVVGIVAGLVMLAAMGWFWLQQPDPEPMDLSDAFASLDYEFAPPPTEFQTMEVDSDVLEGIFNPEATQEEIERQIAQAQAAQAQRSQQASASAGSAGSEAPDEEDRITDVDLADGGTDHHLSDAEINEVIMADFSSITECILDEARRDSSFRGVTVQFFIRPSGTTGGVGLEESQYEQQEVGQCLIERFRNLRFPEHGAVHERGVQYPLRVQ